MGELQAKAELKQKIEELERKQQHYAQIEQEN